MGSKMGNSELRQLRPFISILFITTTLLGIVFVKMEERRISYVVLKLTQEHKKAIEMQKQKEFLLAKLTRPQLLENVATQKLTLKRATAAQIIQLQPTETVATANSPSARTTR
ncbi:MAG: histidine kinase [Pseudobdellovibrio sp.]